MVTVWPPLQEIFNVYDGKVNNILLLYFVVFLAKDIKMVCELISFHTFIIQMLLNVNYECMKV